MSGFPITDEAFFDRPSIRIVGILQALLTRKLGGPWVHQLPDTLNLAFEATSFHSLVELKQYLIDNHQEGVWYRGQTRRRFVHYSGNVYQARPFGLHVVIEGLIPEFYRSITQSSPAAWQGAARRNAPPLAQSPTAVRAIMQSPDPTIRAMLSQFLREARKVQLAREIGKKVRIIGIEQFLPPVVPGTNLPRSQLDFISLTQHYGFGSTMLDVTKSPDVAVWFASHNWDGTSVGSHPDNHGIIYRFNAPRIQDVVQQELLAEGKNDMPTLRNFGLFGLADISVMPPAVAARPSAQSGGSLFGLENAFLHLLLWISNQEGVTVEALTFPHRDTDVHATTLTKPDLCPVDDPALSVFTPAFTDDKSPASIRSTEIETYLRECAFDEEELAEIVKSCAEGLL